MAQLRRELAEVQHQAREAADHHANSVVVAHRALLDAKGGDIKLVGSSEDARKLAFAGAVLDDVNCAEAMADLRAAEYRAALLLAELECEKDARKERELTLAERQLLA
jgi:hypothetical protein